MAPTARRARSVIRPPLDGLRSRTARLPLAPRAADELKLLPIDLRVRIAGGHVHRRRSGQIRGQVLLAVGEQHAEPLELAPLLIGHEGVRHRDLVRDSAELSDEIVPFIGRWPPARRGHSHQAAT
jgi:hypothetical protein